MKEMGGGEERPADQKNKCLTHISRSTAGCGHDTACSFDLRQSKVTDHNFGVFVHAVIQQVLRLQIQEEWSKEDGLQTGKKGNCYISVFPKRWYLQVSVDDPHIVEIFDCIQDLVDELAGISLCVETFLHNPVKQLTSRYPARLKWKMKTAK